MDPESRKQSPETMMSPESILDHALNGVASPRPSGPPTEPWSTAADATTPPPEVTGHDPIRKHFGRYQIISVLGIGGMGKVLKAWDPELKRTVVVKVLHSHGGPIDDVSMQYFQREGQALAQVRHRHVVQVHDACLTENPPYLVMEYLQGGTVQDRRDEFHQDRRAAVALMEKIARAVHHLHEKGLIHRDLKMSNVLLDKEGEPKVSDFGLVKVMEHGGENQNSLREVGTPPYMAPEQTGLVSGSASPQTDVWALGVMLYRLLTGEMPFDDSERSQLFHKICRVPCPAPHILCPDLDRGLEAVILKCLAKRPDDRFATADELADELQRWLDNKPLRTRPDNAWQRVRRFARRRPIVAGALALLAALILALPIVALTIHPDRPEWDIQRDLAAGKAVDLVGDKGKPEWLEWPSRKQGSVTAENDGSFTVACWDQGLACLVRKVPCDHYMLRAQVKHTDGNKGLTEVGLFALHTVHEINGKRVISFVHLALNDQVDLSTLVFQPTPDTGKGNPIEILPRLSFEPRGTHSHGGPLGTSVGAMLYKPCCALNAPWHELELEVRPGMVQGKFDGKALAPVSIATIQANYEKELQLEFGADSPLPSGFSPHGPVGLYVRNATASFRNVRIVPQ